MTQNYAQHETITIAGVEYVSPDSCSFGDYGGCGSYGLANIRAVIKAAENEGCEVLETWFSEISHAKEIRDYNYVAFKDRDENPLWVAIKTAKRKPLVLHASGDYSSEGVYILRHSKLAHEILSSLADYPSLDDEGSSEIEMTWESEAWDSWLRSDLERAAWPGNEEPESDEDSAAYSAMPDENKWRAYRFAMEVCNTYPVAEHNGVYVDVDRIAATYRATIERMLKGETVDAIERAQWPSVYSKAG